MMTLETSIPEAIIVTSVPTTELFVKVSSIGVESVSINPRKKVSTDVMITSTRTPLLPETALQPSLNSLINDWVCLYVLEARPLRTANVTATVTKKVQMSMISSSLISETVSRNPAMMGDIRNFAEPAT
ncbi:hypothetical protein D3C78_1021990 [compost metagenome]